MTSSTALRPHDKRTSSIIDSLQSDDAFFLGPQTPTTPTSFTHSSTSHSTSQFSTSYGSKHRASYPMGVSTTHTLLEKYENLGRVSYTHPYVASHPYRTATVPFSFQNHDTDDDDDDIRYHRDFMNTEEERHRTSMLLDGGKRPHSMIQIPTPSLEPISARHAYGHCYAESEIQNPSYTTVASTSETEPVKDSHDLHAHDMVVDQIGSRKAQTYLGTGQPQGLSSVVYQPSVVPSPRFDEPRQFHFKFGANSTRSAKHCFLSLSLKCLTVIPLAALLGMLQLVTGHGILLNTHHGGIHLGPWKEEPIWHSVVVGLLGGAILSPLVYGIVLLLLYTRRPDDTTQEGFGHGTGDGAIMVNGRLIHRPSTHVPEDFFDDESRYKHGGLTLVRSQTTFTFGAWRLLALIATGLLLGVLTGALGGVIALRALSAEFGVGIVDVEGWALTGTVGGVVVTLGGGALAVAVRILVAWCFSAAI